MTTYDCSLNRRFLSSSSHQSSVFMPRSIVIAKRELSSYFYSPVAYVAMTLFLLLGGFFFWSDFTPGQPVEMRHTFERMLWLLVVIVPILGMGLIAQEWATGTIESAWGTDTARRRPRKSCIPHVRGTARTWRRHERFARLDRIGGSAPQPHRLRCGAPFR